MNKLDFIQVQKSYKYFKCSYQLSLEITDTRGPEIKAICPFCSDIISYLKLLH